MKTTAFYVKSSLLSSLLFIESFLLAGFILSFVRSQKFFAPPLKFMVIVVVLMFFIAITHALIAGAWDKWEQYVFGPLPISLGLLIISYPVNSAYAAVIFLMSYVLLCYEIILASQLKRQLLVFNPRLILKFTTRGIILIYSVAAAIMVIITVDKQPDINIGNTVGNFVDQYFVKRLTTRSDPQIEQSLSPEQMERLSAFGLDPSKFQYVNDSTVTPYILNNLQNTQIPELSLKNTVAAEVNKLVEPYKRFVNPIMAVLVFGLIQFLGTIAYIFYSLIIDLVFWFGKRVNLFIIDRVPAEKEILHF